MNEETRNDIEKSVDEEGRDEAAVVIIRIDARLDELMDMMRDISSRIEELPTFQQMVDARLDELMDMMRDSSSRIEELPTFQQMVDAGAAVVDADESDDVEAEAPVTTTDLSDLDLSI